MENWRYQHQGSDKIIIDDVYYAWDQGIGIYRELTEDDFSHGTYDQGEYTDQGDYFGQKSQFITPPQLQEGVSPWDEGDPTAMGEREGFGGEPLTSELFMGKNVNEAVDYIKDVVYGGEFPGGVSPGWLSSQLEKYMPTVGELDKEKVGFLAQEFGGGEYTDPTMLSQYDFNKDGKLDVMDITAAPDDMQEDITNAVLGGGATRQISFEESLTGRKAGAQREQDIYALQSEAHKFAPAVSTGTGMGGSLRAGIAGQEAIGRGFGSTIDQYGLTKDIAGLQYKKGISELTGKAETKWEREFEQFLNSLPDQS